MPTEHAALTEPMAVGVHAVAKARLERDDAPLVIGCGPVGLAVIAALRLQGRGPIVAADFSPARRELAAEAGRRHRRRSRATQPWQSWREDARCRDAEQGGAAAVPGQLPALRPRSSSSASACPACSTSSWPARRAAAHRGGRRLHGGRHDLPDARHQQGAQPPVRARLHAGRVRGLAPPHRGGRVDAAPLVTGQVGVDGVAQAFEDLAFPSARQDPRRALEIGNG